MKVYLHNVIHNGNIQQNPLRVEYCATKKLSISSRFSPTIFYRDANSVLLRAHLSLYNSRYYAQNPLCSNLFMSGERERLYSGNVQHNSLCAAYCVRIFPSLPGCRLRFFIDKQIQHSTTVHSFLHTPPQIIDEPCRTEAHYPRNLKCLIVLHSTAAPLTTEHEEVFSRCTTRMYSSTFYAQNAALEIAHQ